jgi:hypothetical protein
MRSPKEVVLIWSWMAHGCSKPEAQAKHRYGIPSLARQASMWVDAFNDARGAHLLASVRRN